MEYYKVVLELRYLGERGIYEETGCKSSCHVNIYKLDKRFNFRDDSVKDQVIYARGLSRMPWTWARKI